MNFRICMRWLSFLLTMLVLPPCGWGSPMLPLEETSLVEKNSCLKTLPAEVLSIVLSFSGLPGLSNFSATARKYRLIGHMVSIADLLQLKEAHPRAHIGPTIIGKRALHQLRKAGFTARELRAGGFTITELILLPFLPRETIESSRPFSHQELLGAFSASEYYARNSSAEVRHIMCRGAAYYSRAEMETVLRVKARERRETIEYFYACLDACSPERSEDRAVWENLIEATAAEGADGEEALLPLEEIIALRTAKPERCLNQRLLKSFTARQLYQAQFTASELKRAHFKLEDLLAGGFSSSEIMTAFSPEEVASAFAPNPRAKMLELGYSQALIDTAVEAVNRRQQEENVLMQQLEELVEERAVCSASDTARRDALDEQITALWIRL